MVSICFPVREHIYKGDSVAYATIYTFEAIVRSELSDVYKDLLIPTLGKTMKHVEIMIKGRFQSEGLDLTKNQFVVLKWLMGESRPQCDLALITERDKGSLTRLIQSMERKGYVVRRTSEEDARMNMVAITDQGRDAFNAAEPLIFGIFKNLQKGISAEEAQAAKSVLDRILNNAKKELQSPLTA